MSAPAYNLPSVALAGDRLQVYNCYRFKEALKRVPGARWNPEAKAWEFPAKTDCFQRLIATIPGLKVDRAVTQYMTEVAFREAEAEASSHYEVELKLTPEYKYKPGEPYPTDIVLSMTDGWDVMYTYKSRVQET